MKSIYLPSLMLKCYLPTSLDVWCWYQSSHQPPTPRSTRPSEHTDNFYLTAIGLKVPPDYDKVIVAHKSNGTNDW